jgi:hypothetical protein
MRQVFAGLLLALGACDPTHGLTDSADAVLPKTERYFEGSGSQLIAGPWNSVVVDVDLDTQEHHVGARRSDDAVPTFHVFGPEGRDGCEVKPNAATWLTLKLEEAPSRLVPFLESMDDRGRGRMRFMDLDCRIQDLVVEDAGRPDPRLLFDHGFLVPTKQGYTFADPWRAEAREIAVKIERTMYAGNPILLWADGMLKSFSVQFEAGGSWGNQVEAAITITSLDYLVHDRDGFHHVKFDPESLEFESEDDLLPGICQLQRFPNATGNAGDAWVVAQPCDAKNPVILQLDITSFEVRSTLPLPFEANARDARPLSFSKLVQGDEPVPLGMLFVTEVGDDGYGTLWGWHQGGGDVPIKLGEHASLDTVALEGGSEWNGSAAVNFRRLGGLEVHDWVHFRWDGKTELIAEGVVRNQATGELMVNYDGVAADRPLFSGATEFRIDARHLSPYVGDISSYADMYQARIAEFNGDSGQLQLGHLSGSSRDWTPLANDVAPEFLRFAWFMPALLFLEGWDPKRQSGTLVAYNYELQAKSVIAEGVSSFDLTSYPWDGVVYAVPRGKQQGLWFSKAK